MGVPKRPSLSGSPQQLQDRIWRWYWSLGDCLGARRPRSKEKLAALEVEIRALIEIAEQRLSAESWDLSPDDAWRQKRGWLSAFHSILAKCLRKQGRHDLAQREYRRATELAPYDMHHFENSIDHLVELKRWKDAAECINSIYLGYLATEEDSTARHILHWVTANRQIAVSVRPEVIDRCLDLVSHWQNKRSSSE